MPFQHNPLPKDRRILKFNQKQKFVNIILNKFPDAGALKQELFKRKDLNSVMLAHKIDEDWSFEEYQSFLTRNLSYKVIDRKQIRNGQVIGVVSLILAGVIIAACTISAASEGVPLIGFGFGSAFAAPFLATGAAGLSNARYYKDIVDDLKTDELRTPGFKYECVCEAFDLKRKQYFNDESNIQYKLIFQNYLNKVNKCIVYLKEEFKIETDADIKRNIRYDVNKLNRIKTDLERIISLDYTNYEFYQLYQSNSYFKDIPREIRGILSKYR